MAETQRILVVEDDVNTAEMLTAYFEAQGYEVWTAAWGEDALRMTQAALPDLVVLDIRLPDIDGYEICRRLRAHRRTERIPIIFLTERRERVDRLAGLKLGAVDYVTKPFDIQELRLRVRNALRRASLGTMINPITGLPTDSLIDERLSAMLRQKNWALVSVGVRGLRNYSARYGFVASDDVLRAVGVIIKDVVKELDDGDPFIGHIGEADFIVVTMPAKATALREQIRERLEQSIDRFYPMEDLEKDPGESPKISIGIGVVTPQDTLKSPLDVKMAALNAQAPA